MILYLFVYSRFYSTPCLCHVYTFVFVISIQLRYGHKNMRIRTKPLCSPQRGAESKNKRVLDKGPFSCQTIMLLQNDMFFFLPDKGPSKQIIRTTSTLAKITRNIKKRNGTNLDPFRGTEQQNRERFAMHAGTERKNPERFMDRNGTDRNGNGHISTPLASQKPMTGAFCMSRRDLQLLSFLKLSQQSTLTEGNQI